ncbi:unnamed protein product [Protopolystoma xenopodis]|uniref:Uncharacterized protein n=1 Tax=Protopolystoma xenopodis TaxID=117903 RepID=A0A3S5CJC0_9PLAT|nr:unnamed protein product [Protopolystoma xenopodis]
MIQQKETQIRKQFRDAARIQKKQFKLLQEERLKLLRRSDLCSSQHSVCLMPVTNSTSTDTSATNNPTFTTLPGGPCSTSSLMHVHNGPTSLPNTSGLTETGSISSHLGGALRSEREILENLRIEEKRKQADLEAQYEKSISELYERQNVSNFWTHFSVLAL